MTHFISLNWFGFLRPQRPVVIDGLLSEEQFETVLERERMRADRNESSFALITFTLEKHDVVPGDIENLVRIVRRRVRFTDEIALLSRHKIAIVLTDTSQHGAEPVVADIREQYESSCGELEASKHVARVLFGRRPNRQEPSPAANRVEFQELNST